MRIRGRVRKSFDLHDSAASRFPKSLKRKDMKSMKNMKESEGIEISVHRLTVVAVDR
jgi:hypothetical protein